MLEANEEKNESLLESLKKEYISRAKAVAYIYQNDSSLITDSVKSKEIATYLGIDEICYFDTAGTIIGGTNPEYNGLNVNDGDQISFFKPILSDFDLELCQDMTPNTFAGKMIMYAMVWRSDHEGLIQVGIEPDTLVKSLNETSIKDTFSSFVVNEECYILFDLETSKVVCSTNPSFMDKTNIELDIELEINNTKLGKTKTLDVNSVYTIREIDDKYVFCLLEYMIDYYTNPKIDIVISGCTLFVVLLLFYIVVIHIAKKDRKKEELYENELREALQKATDASEAKSRFLFNMSHDIRTPMNAILGYTELLKRNITDDVNSSYIDKIKTSGDTLLDIINHILEMARIENGKVSVSDAVYDVSIFIEGIKDIFDTQMKDKGLEFSINSSINNNYLIGDAPKIKEILINVISNSYKYTSTGGYVKVNFSEESGKEDNITDLIITISDNGRGMSEEFLNNIFVAFEREHSSTESKVNGTGLGMAITKQYVDLLNGKIDIDSVFHKGTTITITIPQVISNKDALNEENEVKIEVDFKDKRILLAEDNDLNAEIAMEILTEYGFIVERAKDGEECVEKLINEHPLYYDLILMDIQMPKMNGYEATKTIRSLSTNHHLIPIIAMTANAFEEDKKNAFDAGMNAHIAKPFDLDILIDTLQNILKK